MKRVTPDFSSFKPRKSYAVYPKSEGERIPPKGLGSAVPDPHALADVFLCRYEYVPDRSVVLKSNPGVNIGEPAPSLAMDATIDGHQYKGVLYLVSDKQEQESCL